MLSILGWIPLLGPILQGISGLITPFTNLSATKIKTAAEVTIAETQASVSIIQATNDDILLRILRDAFCLPAVILTWFICWDTLWAEHAREMMWHTAALPPSYAWYPTTVAVFLVGNIGLNMWNRK